MKYKVYWFEDNNDWLSNSDTLKGINDIIDFLQSQLNYEIDITFYTLEKLSESRHVGLLDLIATDKELLRDNRLDNYKDGSLETIDFSDVNIVLMDYNLGAEKGNDVIDFIRNSENDIYTDILFYSGGKEDESGLRRIADKDGLYCSRRDDLFTGDKILKVIRTTIKKSQGLNNLRGLVMSESSELDELIRGILMKLSDKGLVREEVIKKKLDEKLEDIDNLTSELNSCSNFNDYVNSKRLFGATVGIRTLKSFTKCENNPLDSTTLCEQLKDYEDNIIQVRNKLAHIPGDHSNSKKLLFDGEQFTEERFIEIRGYIKEYKNILKGIDNLIS